MIKVTKQGSSRERFDLCPRGPIDGGHGHHAFESSLSMLPFLGSLLLLLLLVSQRCTCGARASFPCPALRVTGYPKTRPSAFLPNASRAETSALMSSWSGPAFSTGLPAPSRCRPSLARTAVFDLGPVGVYPTGSSARRMVVGATNAGANPRLNDLPRNRRYRDHAQGEQDHGGYVLPSAWNGAQLASRVERGVQQADCKNAAA